MSIGFEHLCDQPYPANSNYAIFSPGNEALATAAIRNTHANPARTSIP